MTKDDRLLPTPEWTPDILGPGFTATALDLGPDPDGETDVVATVVRHRPDGVAPADFAERPAVLWVHGMSDYFFQDHVARSLHEAGYAFYAVDLRKCGRSWRPGQRWHHMTDVSVYDADLDAAVAVVAGEGHPGVTPLAHSTGGLIAALWLDGLRGRDPGRHGFVDGLVLNSPWIDLQYPQPQRSVVKLLARIMARLAPDRATPDKGLGGYGRSIYRGESGEWDFDVTMKPVEGHLKSWSWLEAVIRGQARLHRGIDVGVPCVVLHSDRSSSDRAWSPALDTSDAVLDVEQIAARTRCLGGEAREVTIPGARHDVFLSKEHARAHATSETIRFLDAVTARPDQPGEHP